MTVTMWNGSRVTSRDGGGAQQGTAHAQRVGAGAAGSSMNVCMVCKHFARQQPGLHGGAGRRPGHSSSRAQTNTKKKKKRCREQNRKGKNEEEGEARAGKQSSAGARHTRHSQAWARRTWCAGVCTPKSHSMLGAARAPQSKYVVPRESPERRRAAARVRRAAGGGRVFVSICARIHGRRRLDGPPMRCAGQQLWQCGRLRRRSVRSAEFPPAAGGRTKSTGRNTCKQRRAWRAGTHTVR